LPFRSQLIYFPKIYLKKLAYIYTYIFFTINASYEGTCVEFERKTTAQYWFSHFQIARKYQTYFMTDPLNIIFGDFGI